MAASAGAAAGDRPLGPTHPKLIPADQLTSQRANRRWWDADADAYHDEHGEFLGQADFVWCPENLRESDAQLLGAPESLVGQRILEVGCGSAPCSRWLAAHGALPVAFDVSAGMLRHAVTAARSTGVWVPLVQADVVQLPFATGAFDTAFSAFGGIPFVADSAGAMREVFRVLKPGGRWVFSVTHPMRWIFADVPGPAGMTAIQSYFDRSPYVEVDEQGVPAYVEHHRTMGDRIRELVAAGFVVDDVIEPQWPEGFTGTWGQWTPERGEVFPGTAIFVAHRGKP
ncbi:class I SAM-dependent methyltransferase [Nakamurella aerolata]|uniref:Class I SAM-dependent methyltransferase n=1 Tax=Nakamurella aerolata TaxID=1656892 RepID=A0A849A672_9ACTN|nr:class I SAM-dependent methyltransferase [Nakamurella aerolata]NNG34521.1 class I SAM-dependent methyltransferase [Nakamurella aerolata]